MINNNFKIGQIVYILSKGQLMPFKVVEKTSKETMDGIETSYSIQSGNNSDVVHDLSEYLSDGNNKLFLTTKDAKSYLIEQMTNVINKIIETSILKQSELFPDAKELSAPEIKQETKKKEAVPRNQSAQLDVRDASKLEYVIDILANSPCSLNAIEDARGPATSPLLNDALNGLQSLFGRFQENLLNSDRNSQMQIMKQISDKLVKSNSLAHISAGQILAKILSGENE